MKKVQARKRNDGRYEARKMVGHHRISAYGSTPTEAKRNLNSKIIAAQERKDEAKNKGKEPLLLKDAVKRTITLKRGTVSEKTYVTDVSTFNSQILTSDLANMDVTEVAPLDIQRMLISKALDGYSRSTINKIYSLLSETFKMLLSTGKISYDVMILVKKPNNQIFIKEPAPVKVLSVDALNKLASIAEEQLDDGTPAYRYGEALILMMHTGLRTCELQALRLEDIDLCQKTLYVNHSMSIIHDEENDCSKRILHSPKTEKSKRPIPLDARALLAVERLIDTTSDPDTGYLISTSKGNVVTYGMLLKCFDRILKKAHIEHTGLHTLRHSFATNLLRSDVGKGHIKEISELLGHSTVSTTYQYYIGTDNENKRNLVDSLNDALSS